MSKNAVVTTNFNRAEEVKKLFTEGYNCSQAVFAAYAEDLGLDKDIALKISSSFGGGMGKLREVCGAVTGMFMVAGMLKGYTDPAAYDEKSEHYQLIQQLGNRFKEVNGSIICRELLALPEGPDSTPPEKRNDEYYKKRPCKELVGSAAQIIDEILGGTK